MKMIKHYSLFDRSILVLIVLSLHENKAHYITYNHTLDFINAIKINFFVMNVVDEQVTQEYEIT